MSRPLRIEYEDAFYHVMNRGGGRKVIFPGEAYYQDYLRCLDEAHRRFGIEIHAYCLMGNHYHLLVKTPRGNLGRAMRHIDGVYVQRHNRRKKTDGSLFRGRYKAIVVDASSYLLQLSRYIHRNPIELKKPLVSAPEEYAWSSYSAYLAQSRAPEWLNRDAVYGELASQQRYSAYRAYVESGNDEETTRFYSLKNTPSILGDKFFKENAYGKALSLDIEIDKKGMKVPVSLEAVVACVAAFHKIDSKGITLTKRGRGQQNLPRWIAMKLCQEVGSAKLHEIAKLFRVGHYSTVSQTIARLNRLMEKDVDVLEIYNTLSQDLTP